MNKSFFLFLLSSNLFFSSFCFALEVPITSRADSHIQKLNYDSMNVTKIVAQTGFVTAINFSDDESINDIVVGFKNGWQVIKGSNKIFLTPVAFHIQGSNGNNEEMIEPNGKDWRTNMIVTTNKRIYSFDLNLSDLNDKPAYIVSFSYPNEEKQEKQEKQKEVALLHAKEQKLQEEKNQTNLINNALNKLPIPKNWNYSALIPENSQNISPNFVYDDGEKTYFGFDNSKSIPAFFSYAGEKQEMMTNISPKKWHDYTIIMVQKTANKMILRSGDQVVGIINKSFGKYIPVTSYTSNSNVKRELIN